MTVFLLAGVLYHYDGFFLLAGVLYHYDGFFYWQEYCITMTCVFFYWQEYCITMTVFLLAGGTVSL